METRERERENKKEGNKREGGIEEKRGREIERREGGR